MVWCRAFASLATMSTVASMSIGRGIADMTGPAMEVNLMGYGNPAQVAGGIHQRLFARAFVFDDGLKKFAYVSADIGMGSDLLNQKVVERLEDLLGPGVYGYENLVVSGTHTHSAPAGYLQYVLFQTTSWGFMNQTFSSYVDGVAEAVVAAHNDLQPASATLVQGELQGANINRSPTSYLLNPDASDYDADTDLNMLLLSITSATTGEQLGVLNWFAVHGTSLNNTNRLLSGDNRGYASYLLEKHFNGPTEQVAPGKGKFVGAFASTNLGDVSPNTNGAKCLDTGLPCDAVTSTCNGRNELCVASGPGADMFASMEIIGRKQADHALGLLNGANASAASKPTPSQAPTRSNPPALDLSNGPVDFVHAFVNMSNQTVNGTVNGAVNGAVTATEGDSSFERNAPLVTTCRPAMGYAFAAGTTDGPGAFNFHQATNETTPFWEFITDKLLDEPSPEQVACQAPKPILLNLGGMERPYPWDAEIVPVQLLRVGLLFIASVPAEFTTMAGRRLRSALKQRVVDSGLVNEADAAHIEVAIAGLANSYSDYVTTYEEYQAQRYEAASTIFGPHTHQAYVQIFEGLVDEMAAQATAESTADSSSSSSRSSRSSSKRRSSSSSKRSKHTHLRHSLARKTTATAAAEDVDNLMPPDLSDVQLQAIPDHVAVIDATPKGSFVGELVVDVHDSSLSNKETSKAPFEAGSGVAVQATWWGANPRSDLKRGSTFLQVERYREDSVDWVVVATDADFCTKFTVERPDPIHHLEQIQATVSWQVPADAIPGTYRLRYLGVATLKRATEAIDALSSSFEVVSPNIAASAAGTSKKAPSAISTVDRAMVPKMAPEPALNSPLPL